jgi:hypothetical protein
MNSRQAKEILLLYRPGCAADEADPDLQEALDLVRHDADLQHWFDQHCAFQSVVRQKLREIEVPADLKQRILAKVPAPDKIVWWKRRAFVGPALAAAAAIAVLLGFLSIWLGKPPHSDFASYRDKMVSKVLREYSMDLVTTNAAAIREFIARNEGLSDFTLTAGLEDTPRKGCGLLSWRGRPVTMVCFESGAAELFLFVTSREDLRGAPSERDVEFAQVKRLMTMSWTNGNRTYVLAGKGDPESLRRYL